jgi:hypothetical protein
MFFYPFHNHSCFVHSHRSLVYIPALLSSPHTFSHPHSIVKKTSSCFLFCTLPIHIPISCRFSIHVFASTGLSTARVPVRPSKRVAATASIDLLCPNHARARESGRYDQCHASAVYRSFASTDAPRAVHPQRKARILVYAVCYAGCRFVKGTTNA